MGGNAARAVPGRGYEVCFAGVYASNFTYHMLGSATRLDYSLTCTECEQTAELSTLRLENNIFLFFEIELPDLSNTICLHIF